jgi:hypothetical protein
MIPSGVGTLQARVGNLKKNNSNSFSLSTSIQKIVCIVQENPHTLITL